MIHALPVPRKVPYYVRARELVDAREARDYSHALRILQERSVTSRRRKRQARPVTEGSAVRPAAVPGFAGTLWKSAR